MHILKFGGSSLATAERVRNVATIIKHKIEIGERPCAIVLSAFGQATDLLQQMAHEAASGDQAYEQTLSTFFDLHRRIIADLFPTSASQHQSYIDGLAQNLEKLIQGVYLVLEATPRTMDYVLSFGERHSSYIVASFLTENDIACNYVDARTLIKTNKTFGSAQVDLDLTFENVKKHFKENQDIQIVTGFISSAKGGLTTTLGRGGSDYTAALIGAALDSEVVELWTDVNGVLTADPNKVSSAFTIKSLTYAEAVEMSHFGAKVIYPPTIQPLLKKGIPIRIRNSFDMHGLSTLVSEHANSYDKPVKGISSISDIALLTLQGSGLFGVPGVAARLFRSLANAGINVILITQGSSEHSISFAIQPSQVRPAKRRISKEFEFELSRGSIEPIKVEEGLSVIAIIGENMRYMPGVAGKMLTALGNNGINAVAIAQGSSELNLSVVINAENEKKALNVLHEAFFLSETKVIHLFMVGVGLIGGTLIKQLRDQEDFLRNKRSLEIKVVGLANTKKMLFNPDGIDLANWKESLADSSTESDISGYVDKLIDLNLSNSVFVDNTADLLIHEHYKRILNASVSISTPNKVATSSNLDEYLDLLSVAEQKNVYFGYETNVGAGLPVISTLRNLVDSGDRILKIEGVLSGSLSFIFNHFDDKVTFSQAVKEAARRGYTEPDPRTDLSGLDVKRKILILAREAGIQMEASEVEVQQILPDYCMNADLGPELDSALLKSDDHFEDLRQSAILNGDARLRVIAKIERGRATISLEQVGSESPFYFLRGSDNMLVFTTERYTDRPLVIQGPGAGAEVTAAGVFAEIIHIGNLL